MALVSAISVLTQPSLESKNSIKLARWKSVNVCRIREEATNEAASGLHRSPDNWANPCTYTHDPTTPHQLKEMDFFCDRDQNKKKHPLLALRCCLHFCEARWQATQALQTVYMLTFLSKPQHHRALSVCRLCIFMTDIYTYHRILREGKYMPNVHECLIFLFNIIKGGSSDLKWSDSYCPSYHVGHLKSIQITWIINNHDDAHVNNKPSHPKDYLWQVHPSIVRCKEVMVIFKRVLV